MRHVTSNPTPPPDRSRRLPVVRIAGKLYFMDARLREFRRLDDFLDRIPFSDRPAYEVLSE